MVFKVGENVGAYRIVEQLGQGGMATVYKAYHAALDRYVALKVMHQAFKADSAFTGRFQREARVVAKLEHPHIVPVYDYSEHEGSPYLVMKFIEGDTLKARLARGPLSSQEIEQVVDSVGSALEYAHRQGILHRDIKPSNVLIGTDGTMYLTDFGLARIAQAGESTLSSDSIMGTPQYISPEQALGRKDLDAGTDIYSFGVMLYELVVGQVPFSADTPFSIIHDHIYTPLPLPMDINPNVPEPVQRVLLKALAKDRNDRYATIAELVNAFKGAWVEAGVPMQGTSIKVRPASLKERTIPRAAETAVRTAAASRRAAKHPAWMWMAAALAFILFCGAGVFAFRGNLRAILSPPPVAAVETAAPLPAPSTNHNTEMPPPPASNEPPQVIAAREAVLKNPGDPNAHLQLSLALWDAGQKVPAIESLAQASNLAGPSNREFFQRAAMEYKGREAWVPAAGMYLRLAQTFQPDEMPVDVTHGLHEAVYRAAEEKDMPAFVFFERVDAVNLPLGYVVRGRYALYHGDPRDARLQLASAEKLRPNMYEVFLLRGEIEMRTGSRTNAKTILLSLSSDLGAPEWIRSLAGELLISIE